MGYRIRPYDSDDAPRIVEIVNKINPMPTTLEQFQWQEGLREKDEPFHRLMAEDEEGRVVGYGFTGWSKMNPTGWWGVRVVIDPADRGRGAGRALYDAVTSIALEAGAVRLEGGARDNDPYSNAWLERRGWIKDRHMFESILDVTAFDPTPWESALAKPAQFGIRLERFGAGRSDEEIQKLYDLSCKLYHDMPGMDNRGVPPFHQWREYVLNSPDSDPNGTFVAVDGENWIGVSGCTFRQGSDAYTWFTGTLPEYRGKGIALALKLRSIEYVRHKGWARMRTNNDSQNPSMLRVNEKLGYRAEPGTYFMYKTIG